MMLTGKAKEMFEEWALKQDFIYMWDVPYDIVNDEPKSFYQLPESMQWGVYQDWADSIGVELSIATNGIVKEFGGETEFYTTVDRQYVASRLKTRKEARIAGLQKLNEIINKR